MNDEETSNESNPADGDESRAADREAAPAETSHSIRLQRFLAQCGLGARRECEALVTSGRITVDGRTVNELGTKVDPKRQDIRLDGERLKPQARTTFVFNKPPGVLCTMKDPQRRPRVVDFFPANGPRLFTVGRLDESSTGLLIVTNDGDLAQKLAHPRYRIYRTYHVHVAGIPGRDALVAVKQGLWFSEGKFKVQSAKVMKRQGRSAILEVVLREGQNREVRRLFEKVGHKVMKLKRVAFGPVRLGSLSIGKYRPMSSDELAALRHIIERNQRPPGAEDEAGDERPRRPKRGKRPQRPSRRPETRRTSEAFAAEGEGERPRRGRHPASGKRREGEQREGRPSGERRQSEGRRFTAGSSEGRPAARRRTGSKPEGDKHRSQDAGEKRGGQRRSEGRKQSGNRFESGEAQVQRPVRPRRPGKPRPQGKPRKPGRDRRPGRGNRE